VEDLQFFDPRREFTVARKLLPHWAQAGTVCFITWRTVDSLPAEALRCLARERNDLLRGLGLDPLGDWKKELSRLPPNERGRIQWSLFSAWDEQLDRGTGACVLARPDVSKIVHESLLHFDGDRYIVTDAVVMPNHVHVLVAFRNEDALLAQCTSWKRYTATKINKVLDQQGEFWQVEQFDHLVRSLRQFAHYRNYIAENPDKARLSIDSYWRYSRTDT
jgi:putative transposase